MRETKNPEVSRLRQRTLGTLFPESWHVFNTGYVCSNITRGQSGAKRESRRWLILRPANPGMGQDAPLMARSMAPPSPERNRALPTCRWCSATPATFMVSASL